MDVVSHEMNPPTTQLVEAAPETATVREVPVPRLALLRTRGSHALVLDREGGGYDSYVDRCHRRVSINRYDDRIGNYRVGFCQRRV